MDAPEFSFVIPTYNCAGVLQACLSAIRAQDYPQERVEILIVDGFSTDDTRSVAARHGAVVLDNPGVIHPAGRPIGIRAARGELIVCLDSDNILPETAWLSKMAAPFQDPEVAAAEPMRYDATPEESPVTRYCALIGGDDPVVVYLGFHERYSALTRSWTGVPIAETLREGWRKVTFLDPNSIPSLGANGFTVRKDVLMKVDFDPFHHINVCHRIITHVGGAWAKVDTGVIHRHGDTVKRFIEKKKRRAERRMNDQVDMGYAYPIPPWRLIWIALRSALVLPVLWDMLRGWLTRPSAVWLLHFPILYGVLFLYARTVVVRQFRKADNEDYEKV